MSDYPLMILDAAQAVEDSKARKDIVKSMVTGEVLRAGVDFGIIPGTDKPTLLKPGAERLCSAFHLDPYFDTVSAIEDFDKPLFFYRVRCHLIHVETRLEIATGIGSCNSKESKYRWRNQNRVCPKCGKETIITGKKEYGGGYLCYQKKGGCGTKFADNAPEIVNQTIGQIENDDVFSIVNTIDKMAQKRALIGAVLIGANASEFFTQDLEDMPGFGVQMEERTIDTTTGEILSKTGVDAIVDDGGDVVATDWEKEALAWLKKKNSSVVYMMRDLNLNSGAMPSKDDKEAWSALLHRYDDFLKAKA